MKLSVALGLAAIVLSGCALTEKATPLDVRLYTLEQPLPTHACEQASSKPMLHLRRVRSGPDLEKRILSGDGVFKVGYYEDRRWTERPERYVQDALARTLFEECVFQRASDGEAPALDVDVIAFQEVKTPEMHAARVGLHIVLSKERVLVEDTVTVNEPVAGVSFDNVVAAISRALASAMEQITRRTVVALERSAAAERSSEVSRGAPPAPAPASGTAVAAPPPPAGGPAR